MSNKIIVNVSSALQGLLPRFLANRELDIATLKTALANNDFETFRALGHKLKGSGGGYGFDALSDLGGRMEIAAAASPDAAVLAALLAEYEDYMARVEVVFVQR